MRSRNGSSTDAERCIMAEKMSEVRDLAEKRQRDGRAT